MRFDPIWADVRFGYGRSPRVEPPASVAAMLAQLEGPDRMLAAWPMLDSATVEATETKLTQAYKIFRDTRRTGDEAAIEARRDVIQSLRREARSRQERFAINTLARGTYAPDAFRERLCAFWADHFTTAETRQSLLYSNQAIVTDAVRPNLTGRFGDMLQAAITHPLMLTYLDQLTSVGENSVFGQRKSSRGLNENLAREVMELHTLGVGGPYSQEDVRQLAELLTGLWYHPKKGYYFESRAAEPGPETVLGQAYGGRRTGPDAGFGAIARVLQDLALHPATARHLATKLATHFVSETPDADLVEAMSAAYLASQGGLMDTYRAMLEHPAAWEQTAQNVKWPSDYLISALRALSPQEEALRRLSHADIRRLFLRPLVVMGQPWERPIGPDGWAEEDSTWITAQGMAARINWALRAPSRILDPLPDPRDFVQVALGDLAPPEVVFAAAAAETAADGVAVVLASPAFQRR